METVKDLQKKKSNLAKEIIKIDGQIYRALVREIKGWHKNFLNETWGHDDGDGTTYFFKNLKTEKEAAIGTVNADSIVFRKEFFDLLSKKQVKILEEELASKWPKAHNYTTKIHIIL